MIPASWFKMNIDFWHLPQAALLKLALVSMNQGISSRFGETLVYDLI